MYYSLRRGHLDDENLRSSHRLRSAEFEVLNTRLIIYYSADLSAVQIEGQFGESKQDLRIEGMQCAKTKDQKPDWTVSRPVIDHNDEDDEIPPTRCR